MSLCSRGLKSEQFSWMWINRLRKSRHDRATAGSQQSIKTQGDCLHLKDTKYHYNKHERAHPSHCRLLFCQHCFALQTIILPQWFDLRRSKTEWTKETMKREEVTVCEKEREEDKKKEQTKNTNENKCWKYNRTTEPPERPPNDPPNDPRFMSCQTQDPRPSLTTTWSAQLPAPPHPFFIPNHQVKKMSLPPIQKRYVRGMTKGTFPPCKPNMLEQSLRLPWRASPNGMVSKAKNRYDFDLWLYRVPRKPMDYHHLPTEIAVSRISLFSNAPKYLGSRHHIITQSISHNVPIIVKCPHFLGGLNPSQYPIPSGNST